jgi:hypothetical protein
MAVPPVDRERKGDQRPSLLLSREHETIQEGFMTPLYHRIIHASGGTYYEGEPITVADAQMMLSNDIAEGRVEVGSFLKIDEDVLILEPPDAKP